MRSNRVSKKGTRNSNINYNSSNHNENILAVLNSLIGNGTDTVYLLQNILTYLVSQQTNNCNKKSEAFFVDNMLHYVNDIMKPQLQKVLKRNIDWQNKIMDSNIEEDK